MKKLLLLLILFSFSLLSFAQTKYINKDFVNLRSDTLITDSNILARLRLGTEVFVISSLGQWSQVEVDGTQGYVSSALLSDEQRTVSRQQVVRHEESVLICDSNSAYAYHNHNCSGLNRCRHDVVRISIAEARKLGRTPCKICY
jgi:uncharacterized protein YgiM (DUF1202 family)